MPGLHIPPTVWGPFFWHTIHLVALGYPKEPTYAEKKAAREFYESLIHLIPCPTCKLHYADHLKQTPVQPSLDTRKDLFTWTVDLHNKVNRSLGKREVTEQEAIAFYSTLGERGRSPVWTPEDVQSLEYKSILNGFAVFIGVSVVLGGASWYWLTKRQSS